MSTEPDKTRARRWFDAINRGDLSVVDELFASDYVLHLGAAPEPSTGRESIRQLITSFRSAFPDLHLDVEDMVAEGGKVAVRWTATGTQHGTLLGRPQTGRRARWTGTSLLRFTGEQIAEDWVNMDLLAMLEQLGHLAGPEQQRA